MIKQISIFTENKRGAAKEIFNILARKSINVLSLANSDSGEFGTMRMIVSDSTLAILELKENGYLCKESFVLAIELDDTPGSLEMLLNHIDKMNIGIDYLYVGYMRESNMPVIILHCDEMEIVESSLKNNGYTTY